MDLEQQTNREAADAKVEQAKAQMDNVQAQSSDIQNRANAVKEAQGSLKQAQMQVKQAETSLAVAQANRVKDTVAARDIAAAKASVDRNLATLTNASKTLDETTVRCPIDGIVLEKDVEQGTIITSGQSFNSSGTTLVQVGDISKMYVNVSVDETDLASIAVGQSVEFTVDAFKGEMFHGKVARISPEATITNNVSTYPARVEVDNTHPMFSRLRPGMNATCTFVISSKRAVLTIPVSALHSTPMGSYVEVAGGGKSAMPEGVGAGPPSDAGGFKGMMTDVKTQQREVEVGLTSSESIEIVRGLQEGEKIVVQTITLDQSSAAQPSSGSPFGGGGPPGGGPPGGGPPGGGKR